MKRKIFFSVFLPVLIAVFILAGAILFYQYRALETRIFSELALECAYLQKGIENAADETAFLSGLNTENRVTLIDHDGTVLFDSRENEPSMTNHLDRAEIISALKTGSGRSVRYSDTQLMKNLYSAKRMEDGRIIRVSTAQKSMLGLIDQSFTWVFLCTLAVMILSAAASRALAMKIVAPINTLDLDHPLNNTTYDELAPLLTRMEKQRRENEDQTIRLTNREREFAAVSENMREGLILLDKGGNILLINTSAATIFHTSAYTVKGKYILALDRSQALQAAYGAAKQSGIGEAMLKSAGRSYQILASMVTDNGRCTGAVILLLDVTEREAAEERRREFTANVSHELKTPLTSISGYAEILRDGLVKPEDTARFAGKIYDEAERMITLIGDIINLSRLDEKTALPEPEAVPLMPIAKAVLERLRPLAEKEQVTMVLDGTDVTVRGIPKLLDEILYNLTENALKYNRPGGSVTVSISKDALGSGILCVSDTGVGIPEEHQSRVFERFYRVDKSHSKEIGGTGLGLSIVKHGAELHGAEIELKSAPGRGTAITLTFPGIRQ